MQIFLARRIPTSRRALWSSQDLCSRSDLVHIYMYEEQYDFVESGLATRLARVAATGAQSHRTQGEGKDIRWRRQSYDLQSHASGLAYFDRSIPHFRCLLDTGEAHKRRCRSTRRKTYRISPARSYSLQEVSEPDVHASLVLTSSRHIRHRKSHRKRPCHPSSYTHLLYRPQHPSRNTSRLRSQGTCARVRSHFYPLRPLMEARSNTYSSGREVRLLAPRLPYRECRHHGRATSSL